MANEEPLAILSKGVDVWNWWRKQNRIVEINLRGANLSGANLATADLSEADLWGANLRGADLREANLWGANLQRARLTETDLRRSDLRGADLTRADLTKAYLTGARLSGTDLKHAQLTESNFFKAEMDDTNIATSDLRQVGGLAGVVHSGPSSVSTSALANSQGKIPEAFLRGCGLSDWEIESVKLYNPDLANEERSKLLYRIYDLQASQAIQISPLFISYSHADSEFVDKIGDNLTKKGVRYWRDIHQMKAGRIEKQIDRGIRQNPTVLLILSERSIDSDWVEHEVRTARELEKEMARDVLCPVALDDSWKSSRWPKRLMEQIMEYNILDFSEWKDDNEFDGTFHKLIDGLELFYK